MSSLNETVCDLLCSTFVFIYTSGQVICINKNNYNINDNNRNNNDNNNNKNNNKKTAIENSSKFNQKSHLCAS